MLIKTNTLIQEFNKIMRDNTLASAIGPEYFVEDMAELEQFLIKAINQSAKEAYREGQESICPCKFMKGVSVGVSPDCPLHYLNLELSQENK